MGALEIGYSILAIFGGIFLLLAIIGGGDHDLHLDVGHADFDISNADVSIDSVSVVSMRFLATFGLIFGATGLVALNSGAGVLVQLLSSFVVAFIVTSLYYIVMKFMYSMQGNSATSTLSLIGLLGTVVIGTTEKGLAQVRISTFNGNAEYLCYEINGKQLDKNDLVLVKSTLGINLMVEKQ